MDRSEVVRLVESVLPELQRRLGLEKWSIAVEYSPREDGNRADCVRLYRYDHADIGFDPAKFADASDLEKTIRHELFHVLHSPFDLFWSLATAGLEGVALERAESLWAYCCEQQVIALERMYQGLSVPPSSPPPSKDTVQRCPPKPPKSRPKATPRAEPKPRPT